MLSFLEYFFDFFSVESSLFSELLKNRSDLDNCFPNFFNVSVDILNAFWYKLEVGWFFFFSFFVFFCFWYVFYKTFLKK